MYVIVGIASYNEADSIAGVVRAADQGLLCWRANSRISGRSS
jgi:hypothetical protein